jgi:hypothetical protein
MIFLPGDRIPIKGFGWAPRTWMSADMIDHPDPISLISKAAKLDPRDRGLLVEYPGFLLHCEDREAMLSSTHGDGFWFPSDNSLTEWYHVDVADDTEYSKTKGIMNPRRREELAIILCRPRPSQIAEIGLLVEVHYIDVQKQVGQERETRTFLVYVRRRVLVRRETAEEVIRERRATIEQNPDSSIICGEALDDTQQWYVDCRTTDMQDAINNSQEPLAAATISRISLPRNRPIRMPNTMENAPPSGSERDTSKPPTEHSHGSEQHTAPEQAPATTVTGDPDQNGKTPVSDSQGSMLGGLFQRPTFNEFFPEASGGSSHWWDRGSRPPDTNGESSHWWGKAFKRTDTFSTNRP